MPGPGEGREKYCTAAFRKMPPLPRRLVSDTLRWMPGRTWVRHQPPGGQHRCLRCCRRIGSSSAPQSRSSTQCRWSQCSSWSSRRWWKLVDFSHTSRFRRCRAGYRCAQDCVSTPRCSHSPPCTVVGGTADGSADDRFLFFLIAADYGAER